MSGSPHNEPNRLDQSLDALGHPHRRRLLTRLKDHNPLDDDAVIRESPSAEPEQLLLEIHHRHLPKLVDAGYVDWDREENVLRRGPRFDEIAPLIELMVVHRDELPVGWP